MSFVVVREARDDDTSFIEQHRSASRAESTSFRGSTQDDQREYTSSFSLVATIENEVVGSCTCSLVDRLAFVSHVYVDPDARRVGVGDAMLSQLLDRARQHATRVLAHALPGDRELKNLYERHGLTAQTIVVGRGLRD